MARKSDDQQPQAANSMTTRQASLGCVPFLKWQDAKNTVLTYLSREAYHVFKCAGHEIHEALPETVVHYAQIPWRSMLVQLVCNGENISLRNFQQTPGTDPRYPKIQIWHKQVVEGLGYVPGVCWNFLRIRQKRTCIYGVLLVLWRTTCN